MLDSIVTLSVTMLGVALTGVIWGIRLEGRVDQHAQLFAEREKLQDFQFTTLQTQNELLRLSIAALDAKVDRLLSENKHGRTN